MSRKSRSVFTPDAWVEELHRHLTDHGGARVRQIVVEPEIALEEEYDVLVVSHRWPALTHAFVADLHGRGRAVLGVCDREEPSARAHLVAVGVDEVIESDLGPRAFVAAMQTLRVRRTEVARPDPIGIASAATWARRSPSAGHPASGARRSRYSSQRPSAVC